MDDDAAVGYLDPVELVGGPLDGDVVETEGWTDQQRATGVAMVVPGWMDRALYGPAEGDPPGVRRWVFEGAVS